MSEAPNQPRFSLERSGVDGEGGTATRMDGVVVEKREREREDRKLAQNFHTKNSFHFPPLVLRPPAAPPPPPPPPPLPRPHPFRFVRLLPYNLSNLGA